MLIALNPEKDEEEHSFIETFLIHIFKDSPLVTVSYITQLA